jgi:hypothetical protein
MICFTYDLLPKICQSLCHDCPPVQPCLLLDKPGDCNHVHRCCTLLADSHSSTLLLTRLAELYRQTPSSSSSSSSSSTPTTAAAAGPVAEASADGIILHPSSGNGIPGVAFQNLRASGYAPFPTTAAAAGSVLITGPAEAAAGFAAGVVGAAAVVQMAGPPASKGGSASSSWSKDKLQPAAVAAAGKGDWQSPGTLKVGATRVQQRCNAHGNASESFALLVAALYLIILCASAVSILLRRPCVLDVSMPVHVSHMRVKCCAECCEFCHCCSP